jgi:hypothetical protein
MFDRPSNAFQRALEEARRQDRALNDDRSGGAGRPRVRASFEFGPAPGSGGEARFAQALDWTDEPADRVGSQASTSTLGAALNPEDTSAEIAAELGLSATLTPDQLASRWRNFVWRNHPDRQPRDAQERANARVAIANALYDRARRELAKRR